MSRKWWRRGFALAVVAITVGIAWAATGSLGIDATPGIIGIRHQQGTQATGTVTLSAGSGGFTGKITYSCGVPPAMQLSYGTGDPLSMPPNTTLAVLVDFALLST
jgi:hypothetical protein